MHQTQSPERQGSLLLLLKLLSLKKNCEGCWRRRARAGQSCDDCQQTSQSQARPPGTAVLRWPRPIVSILRVIASESDTNLQRRGILKTSFFFLFLLFSFQQERAVSVKIGSPGLPAPGSHLHFYHRVRQIDNRGGGGRLSARGGERSNAFISSSPSLPRSSSSSCSPLNGMNGGED